MSLVGGFVLGFCYLLITGAASYFVRYAVLSARVRWIYAFTVAPVLLASGFLGLAIVDVLFDLGALIGAAGAADETFYQEHGALAVLLEVVGVPTETAPFVAMLSFTPGAAIGVFFWYWVMRKLDRVSPEERATIAQSIEARAEEDREVERRFALVLTETDAMIRGPRGKECPRCRKKLTFFNRAHGENLRVCAECYRQLAHLGAAAPIRKKLRAEIRAERAAAEREKIRDSRPTTQDSRHGQARGPTS